MKKIAAPIDTVLTRDPNSVKARLQDLERRVLRLERLPFGLDREPFQEEEPIQRKPGPKEKIPDGELLHRRDVLINWLEVIWPEILEKLLVAKTGGDLSAIFEPHAQIFSMRHEAQKKFLENPAALLEFLQSLKFRMEPPKSSASDALNLPWSDERRRRAANQFPTRQIANAMAGVPDLAWRTSFDRCFEHPSALTVALNTETYYRQKFDIRVPKERKL